VAALEGYNERGTHEGCPYNLSHKPGGTALPRQLAHRVGGGFEREGDVNRFLV